MGDEETVIHTAGGEASGLQAEASFDEYDPSQAVQIDFPRSQDSDAQSFPHNSVIPNTLENTTSAPTSHVISSTKGPFEDDTADDRQSLSRSMSRASSQSSGPVEITTSHEHTQGTNKIVEHSGPEILAGANGVSDVAQPSSLNPISDSTSNVPSNSVVPNHVLVQNHVLDQSSTHPVENGITKSVTNLAAVIPDTGASSHNEITLKPSETLPAPTMTEVTAPNKLVPPTHTTAAPRARLPNDTIGILEDRIKEDPRGDLEAWLNLIAEHKKRGKHDDARATYDRFLTAFPSAAEVWVSYVQMENEIGERHKMDTILSKALPINPYLPLWSMYLDHIRRHNNLTTDTSGQARQIIHQAYDVALKHTGLDKESGKLWQDYVNFIKSGPGTVGGSSWQDQQKMDSLRKVYQRAICIPHQFTNLLWKEYDGFERGLNKMTGHKFLQEQSPAYMSARSSYTELQNITRSLRRTTLPVLPPAPGYDGDIDYQDQLNIWKRWIQWEKDDPLVLKQEDVEVYRERIIFVYKHALMAMRFWPELWSDASDFCFTNNRETEGNDFLTQGISANPESCLLAFKRADRIESSTANEEGDDNSIRRGAAVREPFDKVLDALYELITKSKTREAQEIARIETNFTAPHDDSLTNGVSKLEEDKDGDEQEEEDGKAKQKSAQVETIKAMHAAQINLLSKTLSHVWIALIRAMRRIQGKGKVNDAVAGLRGTFADARKRGRITSDVYITCALLEFHCYEVETGRKIFERGLKLFPEDEAFALEYIKHLVANNDHTNARVVFETAVGKLAQKPETVSKAKPLYVFFHEFESRYGEMTQIVKLEKRMKDLFPDDPKLATFSNRFIEQGFDPTAVRPIVSAAAQTKVKVIPTIETGAPPQASPPNRPVPQVNSPKRPLPVEDDDNEGGRPQKLARTTREVSPLKGAAGRRLDQQKRNQPQTNPNPQYNHNPMPLPPPPPPLPRDVMFLLSIIPKAGTYHATKFSPEAMVRLIRDTQIPLNVSQLPPGTQGAKAQVPPQPPQQPHPLPHAQPVAHPEAIPQYQQHPQIPQMPPSQYPPMPPGQYPGQISGGYPQSSSASTPSAFPQYYTAPQSPHVVNMPNGIHQPNGIPHPQYNAAMSHSPSGLGSFNASRPPSRHMTSDEIDDRIAALTRIP